MGKTNSSHRQGIQGWQQFLNSKKMMLNAFDQAREYARVHEVQTYHGRVAEAEFRRWLSDFLPKRYGVTSGYVISQGILDDTKAPHFDVIIYDQLESPVLWVESHPDASQGGMSRAIPVEYVRAVIEVKSSFESSTVEKALDHLSDLEPLLVKMDEPNARYKQYLPPSFFYAVVFFELRKENEADKAALKKFTNLKQPNIPLLGIILRSESFNMELSGEIEIALEKSENVRELMEWPLSNQLSISGPYQTGADEYQTVLVLWSEAGFASFAFDIVALLNGTYEPGKTSSFYGMNWINTNSNDSKTNSE